MSDTDQQLTNDGQAEPHTPAYHAMEIEIRSGIVHLTATCDAPEGADCRLEGLCDCEEWTVQRDPDGTPFHTYPVDEDDEPEDQAAGQIRHAMRDSGECNVLNYLNEDDPAELLTTDGVVATIPIKTSWDYGYTWEPA